MKGTQTGGPSHRAKALGAQGAHGFLPNCPQAHARLIWPFSVPHGFKGSVPPNEGAMFPRGLCGLACAQRTGHRNVRLPPPHPHAPARRGRAWAAEPTPSGRVGCSAQGGQAGGNPPGASIEHRGVVVLQRNHLIRHKLASSLEGEPWRTWTHVS